MQLGIVSNCWQIQLARQAPLENLIRHARDEHLRVIELRQGALGRFETPDGLPLSDRLAELPQQFDDIQFNLALAVGFLSLQPPIDDSLFTAGIAAARALAGRFPPHLRLVDLQTSAENFSQILPDQLAATLIQLATPLAESGGLLSVENAREPWQLLIDAISSAHRDRPDIKPHLKLCYDPVNLLMAADSPNPLAATASLAPDALSMVHFKQKTTGPVLSTVTDGQINWPTQISALKDINYHGPGLLEIAPHENIRQNITQSLDYLSNSGLPPDNAR